MKIEKIIDRPGISSPHVLLHQKISLPNTNENTKKKAALVFAEFLFYFSCIELYSNLISKAYNKEVDLNEEFCSSYYNLACLFNSLKIAVIFPQKCLFEKVGSLGISAIYLASKKIKIDIDSGEKNRQSKKILN